MKRALLVLLLSLAACGEAVLPSLDVPDASAAPSDASAPQPGQDAALPDADAGTGTPDAGETSDAGEAQDAGGTPDAGPGLWVTAYIAGWNLNVPPNAAYGTMPGSEVDYSAFTHGVLFSTTVSASGTLEGIEDWGIFAPDRIRSAINRGHAAGTPILFSVGGGGNTAFATAIATADGRATLLGEILAVLDAWGFDGVDLDLEPIRAADEPNFSALVRALAPELAARTTPLLPRPLLTVACTSSNAAMFAELAGYFDQINLMTYDLSGAWEGWITWHNAPIYDGGNHFPSTGGAMPSADGMVDRMIAAGVPAAKLGIGLDFYGYVWSGGTGTPTGGTSAPMQGWTTEPTVTANISYADILATLYQPARYRWDEGAQAAWLSVDEAGSADDKFVSYDDATTARRKIDYVRAKGIGGMIIWELSGAYLPDAPAGQRDPLLQAVKAAAGL